MTEKGGFWPLFEEVSMQSNSNLVCTLIEWVFRIHLLFSHVGQILAILLPQNDCKWWFPTIFWKSTHVIAFKLGMHTYLVSFQKWFAFPPRLPNFDPLVDTKWLKLVSGHYLKMVVSDHHLKKYLCNPIQTCRVHLLNECSEFDCFLAMLDRFWPPSGHKMTENGGFQPVSVKISTQSNSNLVCALIGWVQNWFAFWPYWTDFGHLVAKKWLKMVVSEHYLTKYSRNSI